MSTIATSSSNSATLTEDRSIDDLAAAIVVKNEPIDSQTSGATSVAIVADDNDVKQSISTSPAASVVDTTPHTDVIVAPRTLPIIQSINASCSLNRPIIPREVARKNWNCEYNPRKIQGCLFSFRYYGSGILFQTARLVLIGSKSTRDTQIVARKIAKKVARQYEGVCIKNFELHNITASASMGFMLDLRSIASNPVFDEFVTYEPDNFPGLYWKLPVKSFSHIFQQEVQELEAEQEELYKQPHVILKMPKLEPNLQQQQQQSMPLASPSTATTGANSASQHVDIKQDQHLALSQDSKSSKPFGTPQSAASASASSAAATSTTVAPNTRRSAYENVTICIFHSGKITITGARREHHIYQAFEKISEILYPYAVRVQSIVQQTQPQVDFNQFSQEHAQNALIASTNDSDYKFNLPSAQPFVKWLEVTSRLALEQRYQVKQLQIYQQEQRLETKQRRLEQKQRRQEEANRQQQEFAIKIDQGEDEKVQQQNSSQDEVTSTTVRVKLEQPDTSSLANNSLSSSNVKPTEASTKKRNQSDMSSNGDIHQTNGDYNNYDYTCKRPKIDLLNEPEPPTNISISMAAAAVAASRSNVPNSVDTSAIDESNDQDDIEWE